MRRIQSYDTTLRDGSQGEGVNFSLQDKLLITERLDSLGLDYVEGGYQPRTRRTPSTSNAWPKCGWPAREGLPPSA